MSEWTKFDKNNPETLPSNNQVVMIAWRENSKDEWNNAICKTWLANTISWLEAVGVSGRDLAQDWDCGWVKEVYWKPHNIQHP